MLSRHAARLAPVLGTVLAPILLPALALAGPAAAQSHIYGLSETGKLCINGTVLDDLKSGFDPDTSESAEQRWWDLAVIGPDRYALRLDGRLAQNGKIIFKLPFTLSGGAPVWGGISATNTAVYAIRTDGLLTANGNDVQNFPAGAFFFQRCLGVDPDVHSLRSDGAIFLNASTTPQLQFVGGEGIGDALDGAIYDTLWFAIAVHPTSGEVYALRRDGKLWKSDPDEPAPVNPDVDPPFEGEEEAVLPFPIVAGDITEATRYQALEFDAAGVWHVLRGDGAVFTSANETVPLIDLPGEATGAPDETFLDLRAGDGEFFATRWDGKVFDQDADSEGDALFDMTKQRYRRLALSLDDPDLTFFKNPKPKAAIYKTKAIEGVAITVPILVSDIELLPEALVVTAPDPLPPGAVWDEILRTLTWDAPGPAGTYKFVVTASDGFNPKPSTFKYSIKVLAPDTDPLKNKPPLPTKIAGLQALVGQPLSFPVLAVDPDGDPLTITVNTAKPPFTAGATFDEPTDTFAWTPEFDDIGKVTAHFQVSDGTKTVTLAVPIKVVNSLIF